MCVLLGTYREARRERRRQVAVVRGSCAECPVCVCAFICDASLTVVLRVSRRDDPRGPCAVNRLAPYTGPLIVVC
eukprot:2448438-Pyramimonas_sp.AAC.2